MKILRMVFAVPLFLAVIFGVACLQGGADPAEEILAEVRGYAEAMETADQEAALAFYSEDWGKDGATKEDLKGEFAEGFFAAIYPGVEVGLDQVDAVVCRRGRDGGGFHGGGEAKGVTADEGVAGFDGDAHADGGGWGDGEFACGYASEYALSPAPCLVQQAEGELEAGFDAVVPLV